MHAQVHVLTKSKPAWNCSDDSGACASLDREQGETRRAMREQGASLSVGRKSVLSSKADSNAIRAMACAHARARVRVRARAPACPHLCVRVVSHVRACARACVASRAGVRACVRAC
eukprot:2243823-Alexandrium_andersonii.AAC.1